MKRTLKIIGITLASLIGILIIAIIIICNVIFSPQTLTPIIRNNIGQFITCQTNLDNAELTFFSTFPNFAINITNVELINPVNNAPNDTLATVGTLVASINLSEYIFNNNIIINKLHLNNTKANIFCNKEGKTNYDILAITSDEEEEKDETPLFDILQLNDIQINNLSATYIDQSTNINTNITGLNGSLKGELQNLEGNINALFSLESAKCTIDNMHCSLQKTELSIKNTSLHNSNIKGTINLNMSNATLDFDGERYLDNASLRSEIPAEIDLHNKQIKLKKSLLALNTHEIKLNGSAQLLNEDINLDLQYSTNKWNIDEIIALLPNSYHFLLDGIDINGIASLSGSVEGTYNNNLMPIITANIEYTNGKLHYIDLPYKLHNINTSLTANINLNELEQTKATIHNFDAYTGNTKFNIKGTIDDLLGTMLCDIKFTGDVNHTEFKPLLPEDMKVDINGRSQTDITARFHLDDLTNLNLDKITAKGTLEYSNLDIIYEDSLAIKDNKGVLSFQLPSPHTNKHFKELAQATLIGNNIDINMSNTMQAKAYKPNITIGIGDIFDTTQYYTANCQFKIKQLQGTMDTINFDITHPEGNFEVYPTKKNKLNPTFNITYANDAIKGNLGSFLNIDTKLLKIKAHTAYDKDKESLLDQLNPTLNFDFQNGHINVDGFEADINIPAIKFTFRPNNFDIEKSHIIIDDSDFALSGNITNLKNFANGRGLLRGNLNFESQQTNIDQLMALINGLGTSTETTDETTITDDNIDFALADSQNNNPIDSLSTQETPNPFIVPKRVNITLNTHIAKAIFGNTDIENIGGKLTIKDGEAILEQIGFTTDAAEMQLTGIYRSERRNHLFAGFDFHLLNIDIAKLIDLVPAVDTILPMLNSFAGQAEFHIAAETYLRADYSPKISTLRAAASLEGKDLVLLDSETFSTIAKYMMFNRKTENKVDSISVEMTVYRNEVDLYPFLISMDKWQAVLSGRHNLDNSFNYHISLTDCPLPARLGLDIKGTFDDLKFSLVPCKYKALYKPEKQGKVEKQTLVLKKIISDSLKDNVK